MEYCNCTAIVNNFHIMSTSLLLYLDGLKFCQCKKQLDIECLETSYNWTLYHSVVYNKMCNADQFHDICGNESNIINDDLSRICAQIKHYKRGMAYKEWFTAWSPFCPAYSFAASQEVYQNDSSLAVPYNNMSTYCQQATIIAMFILFLLSLMIIIANVTVLLVVRSDPYFHTPYGYFKASIALADLCVGLLVIPFLIYIFNLLTFNPQPFLLPGLFQNSERDNLRPFFNIAGFFTIFSLSISVYSLAASSLDRFFSISRPFHYSAKKLFTKTRSLVIIIVIWILATIYGLFPLMSSSTTYSLVSATFVLAAQRPSQRKQVNTFDWLSIFNLSTSSSVNNSLKIDLSTALTESEIQINTTEKNNISAASSTQITSETAMYVTLSLYLCSLIVPLVVVWTVNICTVQTYRKNQKKTIDKPSAKKKVSSQLSNSITTPLPLTPIHTGANLSNVLTLENEKNCLKLKDNNQTTTCPNKSCNLLHVPRSAVTLTAKLPSKPNSAKSDVVFSFTQSSVAKVWSRKSQAPSKKKNSKKLPRKLQKVLLRMVMAFTITILPSICALIISIMLAPYTDINNDPKRYSIKIKLYQNVFSYICSVLLFGNSFVNCIIYTVLGKRFRTDTRRIYASKIHATREALRRVPSAFVSFSKKVQNPELPTPTVNDNEN